jgi:penicillin-binding protein 2
MANQTIVTLIRRLGWVAAAIVALLTIRVIDLQGWRGQIFRLISDENRQFRVNLPAERGVFLDRYGQPLVLNTRQYWRSTEPLKLYSPLEALPIDQALLAQVSEPLSVSYSLEREYLRPLSLAHTLGYISPVSETDLAADSALRLTDMIGRLGLEQQYDELLRGRDGYQEFEINSLGEKQAIQVEKPPQPGQSLRTTLDPFLSTVALRAMGGKSGAVVILDAETGALLALVSSPSFNSNLFAAVGSVDSANNELRQAALQQALTDERQLFFNRAVSGLYAPGSIFKLVTASAGLESGAIDLGTTVDDQGFIEAGGSRFANWYYTQYGRVEGGISLVRAITRSNDTFFYKAAEWTGIEKLAEKAREFGFGQITGVEIPSEKAGLVPDPEWKEKTFGERWFLGNTYHLGIGQGDLLVTPVQLSRLIGAFGNGGQLCQLSLITGQNRAESDQCASLGLKPETLAAIQAGMVGVCSAGGTAFPFFDWNAARLGQLPVELSAAEQIRQGVAACKTGTAEFGGADERGYRHTHAWFGVVVGGVADLIQSDLTTDLTTEPATGSALIDETTVDLAQEHARWLAQVKQAGLPKTLAILVLVESDAEQPYLEGSADAAPVARRILDWMMGRNFQF